MKPIQLFEKLLECFGPQDWWPADSDLEVCIGAILTQNTAWTNVEKAIKNLKKQNLLSIKKINKASGKKLARAIKPTGYYNEKAKKLKAFTQHIRKNHNSDLKHFLKQNCSRLRKELLSIWGIGNETADSILCYAASKPVFVVDAYTKRITKRFYGKKFNNYVELQSFFSEKLPKNTQLLNEFHALLVKHGKEYCTKRKPLCEECPINKKCCYYKG